MANETEQPELQLTRVDEDAEKRPLAIQIQGVQFVPVASIDERWEVVEPPTESSEGEPRKKALYVVTLEDGTQHTLVRNLNYDEPIWHHSPGVRYMKISGVVSCEL